MKPRKDLLMICAAMLSLALPLSMQAANAERPASTGRVELSACWLQVPRAEVTAAIGEDRLPDLAQGTLCSPQTQTELVRAATKHSAGECIRLRPVELGIGESVTFDPYHVPEDPRHRWSGFTTDDIYLKVERLADADGKVTLQAKIGLMNRPQEKIVSRTATLTPEEVLTLQGFESANDNERETVSLLLVHAAASDAASGKGSKPPTHSFTLTHRDGTRIEGRCTSLAEVLKRCGEAPRLAIAEGGRRPPRISLDTPDWEIEIAKACDDVDLKQIARGSQLWLLRLDRCPVTSEGLASLVLQPELTNLEVSAAAQLDDGWIAALSEIEALRSLRIDRVDVGLGAMNILAKLPRLRLLEMTHCRIPGEALGPLQAATALEDLDLMDSVVGVAGVRQIAGLPNLKMLNLDGVRVESMPQPRPLANGDIAPWSRSKSLTHLSVKDSRVSITGLSQLGAIPQLYIDHRRSHVSDFEAQRLADQFGWKFHGACSCGCLDIEPRP